jgi:hypothetical protein
MPLLSWQGYEALLLPLIGTAQALLVGDTDKAGGWLNGLDGPVRNRRLGARRRTRRCSRRSQG